MAACGSGSERRQRPPKRPRDDSDSCGDATKAVNKKGRIFRLVRSGRAPLRAAALPETRSIDTPESPPWALLPLELLSIIVNGCDAARRPFLDSRWRAAARGVCRAWRCAVEYPSALDAARIASDLTDPRPSAVDLWVSGRLICASALSERLATASAAAVGGGARDSADLHAMIDGVPPLVAACALVASAQPCAVAYAFSKHVWPRALSWLRLWLKHEQAKRGRNSAVLHPPTHIDGTPGPDAWWVRSQIAGASPVRPWEGMRRAVGGCARAALAAILLRVAARHGATDALAMLLAVDETPHGTADAAMESGIAGHTAFLLRLGSLAATGTDRTRASVICYHGWLGAAAGGQTRTMHALLDAESKRGALATALWRGRCMAEGSPHHPRTAAHAALAHDQPGYFDMVRDREPAFRDAALSHRPANVYLVEALRVGALRVAQWLVDDARDADPTGAGPWLAAIGASALVQVVVDGRGASDRAHHTVVWLRDRLGVAPTVATLAVLVNSAQAFRHVRRDSVAARGRLSADRYSRLLDMFVDIIEVWPRSALIDIQSGVARDDAHADHPVSIPGGDPSFVNGSLADLARYDGGDHTFGAYVVRLFVERASNGWIAGDGYRPCPPRERALAGLDRLAAVFGARDSGTRCIDPWTVVASRVDDAIRVLEEDQARLGHALAALLGAINVALRCLSVPTNTTILVDGKRARLPLFYLDSIARACGHPDNDATEATITVQAPGDEHRARVWSRWCQQSDKLFGSAPASPDSAYTSGAAVITPNHFDLISAWIERISKITISSEAA